MGHGASSGREGSVVVMTQNDRNGNSLSKGQNEQLKDELRKKNELLITKDAELIDKIRLLEEREYEILKLEKEIHELRCVLQETARHRVDTLQSIPEDESLDSTNGTANELKPVTSLLRGKRQAVSGESTDKRAQDSKRRVVEKILKDFKAKQLIRGALIKNDFLKNLEPVQVREIVDCMYPKQFQEGEMIIEEGETGNALYVLSEGRLEVSKEGKVLGELTSGTAFGELAILYNCKRTASIKALEMTKLWCIDRQIFQIIMMQSGIRKQESHMKFILSVPILKNVPKPKLAKIADVLEEEKYKTGDYIIRQGERGDTFHILSKGKVKVTQTANDVEEEIRELTQGDYFGERALLSEDRRTANVVACTDDVECLALERTAFMLLIGNLHEFRQKDYGDDERKSLRLSDERLISEQDAIRKKFADIQLKDLQAVATLGMGGFGRVELVQCNEKIEETFALKCLKKVHIVETRQQDHIYAEKKIMFDCASPFICKLYKTFRDSRYVYMLMEVCLGGELWTILRDRGSFDDNSTRFFVGCVIEAFDYLHCRGIVYRDLKPENLLVDADGYVKLVDFGFAKKIGFGSKTWTFCGTPEYVAPEIILNKGHDLSVDYWALGILLFELLTGSPPFTSSDAMKTYNIILKGMDMLEFPRKISKNAQNLIRRFCRDNPTERLGNQKDGIKDIRKHKWYQGFHWQALQNRTLKPPFKPKIKNATDLSNFDDYPKETDIPPEETSGWDNEF